MAIKILEMKNGIFFTIDSIIAAGIILAVIILSSSIYLEEQPSFHVSYLSQDILRILSTVTVKGADNAYLNQLIGDGTIKELNNTVLEQIGEFWADNENTLAGDIVRNVTRPWVSNSTGIGLWINNESIYESDVSIKKSLAASNMPFSGKKKGQTSQYTRKNPPALWGPAIVEVRVWQ